MSFRSFCVVCIVVALGACASAPGVQRVSAGQTVDIASAGTQISVQRAAAGIMRPMIHSPALQGAAQTHADDIVRSGQFAHTGSDGSMVQSRVAASGYDSCATAENIAQGQPDVRSVVSSWMDSQGHRDNILNPQITQFGFARNSDTWVLVLARPC